MDQQTSRSGLLLLLRQALKVAPGGRLLSPRRRGLVVLWSSELLVAPLLEFGVPLRVAGDGATADDLEEHVLDVVFVDLLTLRCQSVAVLSQNVVVSYVVLLLPLDQVLREHQLLHLVVTGSGEGSRHHRVQITA